MELNYIAPCDNAHAMQPLRKCIKLILRQNGYKYFLNTQKHQAASHPRTAHDFAYSVHGPKK